MVKFPSFGEPLPIRHNANSITITRCGFNSLNEIEKQEAIWEAVLFY